MPYINAVVFTIFKHDANGNNVPDVIDEIFAWAIAADEYLPEGASGVGPFGKYEDLTGQPSPSPGNAVAARLIITVPTAQQFASDGRIFTLGRKVLDGEGEVTDSNWDTTLTAAEILQVKTWWINRGYDWDKVKNNFSASDTRREIGVKIRAWLKNR